MYPFGKKFKISVVYPTDKNCISCQIANADKNTHLPCDTKLNSMKFHSHQCNLCNLLLLNIWF